jgi:hypothetical protein
MEAVDELEAERQQDRQAQQDHGRQIDTEGSEHAVIPDKP